MIHLMTEGIEMEPNRESAHGRPVQIAAQDYSQRTDAPVSQDRFDYLIDALQSPSPRELKENPPQPRQRCCDYGPYHPEDPHAGDRLRSILVCLTDLYTEKDKYDGQIHNFVRKFRLFGDRCWRYGVPEDVLRRAFPIMLKDGAFEFYLTDLARTPMTFDEIVLAIYERFESTSASDLKRFRNLTLRKVMAENREKPIYECFELLRRQLETTYKSFNLASSNNTLLISQLKSAVQDIPLCEPALRCIESTTYRELIDIIRNCLRPSIDLYM